jgi:hypothetical protein
MQKSIIKKQAKDKLEQLKEVLRQINLDGQHGRDEIAALQQQLQETLRYINIYEYFLAQSEIAPDFNVHLKIMEESDKLTTKKDTKETTVDTKKDVPVAEKKQEPPVVVPEKNSDQNPALKNTPVNKKVEISINDKFRMINELFHHNQQEYNIVVEQLNAVKSPEEANTYIDGLIGVYNWDEEKEIVKTLKRIAQKRFL